MYIYKCEYIYMYVYIYIYINMCMHIYMKAYTSIFEYMVVCDICTPLMLKSYAHANFLSHFLVDKNNDM